MKEEIDLPNNEKIVVLNKNQILFKKKTSKIHSDLYIDKNNQPGIQLTDELKQGADRSIVKVSSVPKPTGLYKRISEKDLKNLLFLPVAKYNQNNEEIILHILKGGSEFRNNPLIDFNEFDASDWCHALTIYNGIIVQVEKYLFVNKKDFFGLFHITYTEYYFTDIANLIHLDKGDLSQVFDKLKSLLTKSP